MADPKKGSAGASGFQTNTSPTNSQPATGNAGDLKVLRGQHTEFMWQGLAGVPVNVTSGGKLVTQTRTDDSGQIVLTGLKPGSYQVEIVGSGLVARGRPAGAGAGEEKRFSWRRRWRKALSEAPMITPFTATVNPSTGGAPPSWTLRMLKPYSRASAGQGMRIPFTIPGSDAAAAKVSPTSVFDKQAILLARMKAPGPEKLSIKF